MTSWPGAGSRGRGSCDAGSCLIQPAEAKSIPPHKMNPVSLSFLNVLFIILILKSLWPGLFDDVGTDPVGMALPVALAQEEEVFAIGRDDRAQLNGRAVDLRSQFDGLGPDAGLPTDRKSGV